MAETKAKDHPETADLPRTEKTERLRDDLAVFEFAGTKAAFSIQKLVFTLIVAAVLLPAVRYSIGLSSPKPAELIVAISIAVFSSVLVLWLLDIVGVIPFRSPWVSRSVYGAAIVSILGTSVGVYQGAFSERKYLYEGAWQVAISNPDGTTVSRHTAVLMHSETSDTYWGYSELDTKPDDPNGNIWLEVVSYSPELESATLRTVSSDRKSTDFTVKLKASNNRKTLVSDDPAAKLGVSFTRPR